MTKSIFLVAAEPSGDLLGRELAEALRQQSPEIVLSGIGDREMASVGLKSDIDVSPLSVLGFLEGLLAYPKVVKIADAAAENILSANPDAVVLIDSWGFTLRVAQRVRDRDPSIRLIKLIGPQVWATRAGRAKTLAQTVDHLLAMFDMEAPFYTPHGLKTSVIGSPALGRTQAGDADAFRAKYDLSKDQKVLLVLPGSRRGEIKRVAPALLEAAKIVKSSQPSVQIVIAPAEAMATYFAEEFPSASSFAKVTSVADDRFGAMAAADLAIACSGTVTTELAVQGTPFLVGYKLGWLSWAIARGFLYKPEFMTILNIAAGKEIAPEFFQTKLKSDAIADKAITLLNDAAARTLQTNQQSQALEQMGAAETPAAMLAAKAILEDLAEV